MLLATGSVEPQAPHSPGPGDRVVKCAEQKDVTRARKLAAKQMQQGKLDKAEGCARAVLRIRGETASAADWEQLGIVLSARGKMQGAVNALRNAVARDDHVKPPAEVRVERRLELANALLGVAMPDDAMDQYRECALLAPHMAGPYINGGNVHLHRGNFAAAEHFYRTALQLDPANFDAIVNIGALMAATARGEQAVTEYRRALVLIPDNVDALSNLGSLQMDMGDVKGSLDTFQAAFKVTDERAPLCYNLANAYLANGQVQEAIDGYERAISLDPTLLSAKCSVASLLAMHGRYQEAKDLAQQAALSTPASVSAGAASDGMWRLAAKCLLVRRACPRASPCASSIHTYMVGLPCFLGRDCGAWLCARGCARAGSPAGGDVRLGRRHGGGVAGAGVGLRCRYPGLVGARRQGGLVGRRRRHAARHRGPAQDAAARHVKLPLAVSGPLPPRVRVYECACVIGDERGCSGMIGDE